MKTLQLFAGIVRSKSRSAGSSLVVLTLLGACDWREFDRLQDEAPVVALNRSSDVRGTFGAWVTSATADRTVTVLVGGTPGSSEAVLYSLGTEQAPGVDAVHGGYCKVGGRIESCALANSAAALVVDNTAGEEELCYAYGFGRVRESREGVVVRCRGNTDQSLRAPRGVADERAELIERDDAHQPHFLAADRSQHPVLLSGLPNQATAWFHTASDKLPVLLTLPGGAKAPASFGGQLAVMSFGEDDAARLFAVGAPASDQVWLFLSEDGESSHPVGCLGSYPGFGRSLAAGDVDGDGVDDLVVADDDLVTVFSGASLGQLPPATSSRCALNALPEGGVIASFGCGSSGAAKGCRGSHFGHSLSVGDLDGDGDGEVIVGAPRMTVYGYERAGAVLIYDAEGDDAHELTDIYYSSAAESGDRLGEAVAVANQGRRDIVVAAAPGHGKVLLFYCSSLLPEGARTGRCSQ